MQTIEDFSLRLNDSRPARDRFDVSAIEQLLPWVYQPQDLKAVA
jgi:hypothetical protein